MRFASGFSVAAAGVSICLVLAPRTTVSAKSRVVQQSLRPEFRTMLFMPQAQAPAKSKKSDIALPDGDGKDVTIKHCSTCHGTDTFARQRHDKDKWNQIIDNMTSKGMEATEDELDTMATYLSVNLGPDSPPAAPATPKPAVPNQ